MYQRGADVDGCPARTVGRRVIIERSFSRPLDPAARSRGTANRHQSQRANGHKRLSKKLAMCAAEPCSAEIPTLLIHPDNPERQPVRTPKN